ncbi:uncharacterized protein LOC108470371 [Gossypium arboreum]|uniref:uncharacterized protein LOC108470371 n=1 Tax=Gossypium arboreum TaxID=29729 RepID=UPI0008195895|nr:uncharacterized protein LOC108470371 [Gossypium arboreum]
MGECFPCFGSSNKEGSNGGGSVKKLSKKDSTKDSSVGQPHHVNRVSSGFSQSSVSSQNSRGTKRKWVPEKDVALVACMVDLHNVGTFNAYMGFKAGYLNELEKMLEKVIPHVMLKAKPNLESMIRTLKKDWTIVYDMLSGKNNSGFGWDEHRQLVIAEDAVWNSYINS